MNTSERKLQQEQFEVLNLLDYVLAEFILNEEPTVMERLEAVSAASKGILNICTTEKSEQQALHMVYTVFGDM